MNYYLSYFACLGFALTEFATFNFKASPGLKAGTALALISKGLPVIGLRPVLAAL